MFSTGLLFLLSFPRIRDGSERAGGRRCCKSPQASKQASKQMRYRLGRKKYARLRTRDAAHTLSPFFFLPPCRSCVRARPPHHIHAAAASSPLPPPNPGDWLPSSSSLPLGTTQEQKKKSDRRSLPMDTTFVGISSHVATSASKSKNKSENRKIPPLTLTHPATKPPHTMPAATLACTAYQQVKRNARNACMQALNTTTIDQDPLLRGSHHYNSAPCGPDVFGAFRLVRDRDVGPRRVDFGAIFFLVKGYKY